VNTGLILAAGAGRRFGPDSKLLADLDGQPLIEHAVQAATEALDRVVVVLGARADEIRARAELGAAEVTVCEDWDEGQAASLRHGLALLDGEPKVLVLLGDQPDVSAETIRRMAAEPAGSRASHGGVPGHPVVLDQDLAARARVLRGDQGLRDLVDWRMVEVGPSTTRDVDTPADLDAIRP
jgi:molybdenum cofactor cytidylyltransferase